MTDTRQQMARKYIVKNNGETKYYRRLDNLCEAYGLVYTTVYYHVVRKDNAGRYSNDSKNIIVESFVFED